MSQRSLWQRLTAHMSVPVFFGSAALVVAFVAFGGGMTETAKSVSDAAHRGIARYCGWFYALVVTGLLVLVVILAFGSRGRVRLGKPDDRPEFTRFSWFAMLFAAGMGTGLVFFGVAEPLTHWSAPPLGAEPRSQQAVVEAMRLSFFHWGLHPWAVYIVFGATLTLMHFRFDLPMAPRSLLYPLLGERIHGWTGHVIDIVCTVGTLVGVAASLGLGALQINTGLERLGWAAQDRTVQLLIIAVVTLAATISVVSGVHAGIRRLSQLNIGLAGLMLLFVLVTGPTLLIAELFVTALGDYLGHILETSLWIAPFDEQASVWQRDWTFAYWGWWLAWSPFVGVFVARISKGRQLREFILALLAVPVAGSCLWMTVFGGTAFALADPASVGLDGSWPAADPGFADQIVERPAIALHALLEELPFGMVTGALATLLTVVFFVTSSDSGSFVDDMVTSGGDPNPPRAQRVFWAVSEGVLAGTLLVTDGVDALRTAALSVGLPMALLVSAAAVSLWRGSARALREQLDE